MKTRNLFSANNTPENFIGLTKTSLNQNLSNFPLDVLESVRRVVESLFSLLNNYCSRKNFSGTKQGEFTIKTHLKLFFHPIRRLQNKETFFQPTSNILQIGVIFLIKNFLT